jgi:ferrous iron transport protein B
MEALESQPELTDTEEAELAQLDRRHREISGELLRGSLLGQAGKAIEPVVRPLGWDWKIGIGAIASFPAREVIIATLGTIYSLGGDVETDEPDEGLMERMQSARWDSGPRQGEKVYNLPVALSIMVFFALCAQCAATLMTIQKESNSWRWPLFTFAYMTALAYVGALVTYQVGMAVWGA